MDPSTIIDIGFVAIFVLMVVVAVYTYKRQGRESENLAEILQYVSNRCGLEMHQPETFKTTILSDTSAKPYLAGDVTGLHVIVYPTRERQSGSATWDAIHTSQSGEQAGVVSDVTLIKIPLPASENRDFRIEKMPHGLARLFRKDMFRLLRKNPPAENIHTGDRAFDQTFYLTAHDEHFLRHVLNATVRKKLVDAWRGPVSNRAKPNWLDTMLSPRWSIALKEGQLVYREFGHWTRIRWKEKYAALVDAMIELARSTNRVVRDTRM